MAEIKTPMQLIDEIINNNDRVIRIGDIAQALRTTSEIKDEDARATIVEALADSLRLLATDAAWVSWNARDLRDILKKQAEDPEAPVTEDDLNFKEGE